MKSGALRYYGGKAPMRELTRWIVSLIPWERQTLYVEPCCGMAGVLMSRPPTNTEIISDANERLANWWRVIRDQPEEFARAIDWTHQRCEPEFRRCLQLLDDPDPVTRAVAYTCRHRRIDVSGRRQTRLSPHLCSRYRYVVGAPLRGRPADPRAHRARPDRVHGRRRPARPHSRSRPRGDIRRPAVPLGAYRGRTATCRTGMP